MKRVLILLDYYMPKASANGICINKVVSELLAHGLDIFLICYADDGRIKEDDKIRIYEIKKSKGRQSKCIYYLKWLLPLVGIPQENQNDFNEFFDVTKKVIKEEKIDTVICTFLPIESLHVGKEVKKIYPKVRTVAYMLDSFSGGFLPRFLPIKLTLRKKLNWEKDILENYNEIILMESSRQHHELYSKKENWYQKARYLDVPAFTRCTETKVYKADKSEEIVMCFVGTISDDVRTPYTFLKIMSYIKDIKVHIIFVGNNTCKHLNQYLFDSDTVKVDFLGEMKYEDAQEIVKKSDILINFGNINSNLVPSKIFEYMSYGKPIISTYTSLDDTSLTYLRKYPVVFFIYEHDSNYADCASKLKEFILECSNQIIEPSYMEKILYKNTPRAFYDTLVLTEKRLQIEENKRK